MDKNKKVLLAFLDLKSAFDMVSRMEIWKILKKKGIGNKLIRVIRSTYHSTKGIVRIDGMKSEEFEMRNGVKQGDSLSPLLFIILLDEIIKTCKRRTTKLKVGNWNMRPIYSQVMVYADDIVLIAETQQKLQQTIIEWIEILKDKGLIVNTEKCKVMQMGKMDEDIEPIQIECNGQILEQVESYEYLGTIIQQNGKIKEEILNRTRKASNIYYQLSGTIFGKKEIAQKTKLQVYKSVIEPVLLYGGESWPARGADIKSIGTVEMKCYRRIMGKTRRDRIRNDRIREDLKQESVEQKLEKRQLKWFGHVVRMDESRKPKQIMEARVEGIRTRGRPRKGYMDRIEDIGRKRGKGIGEMKRLARTREEWRKWIEAVPTL